MKVATLLAAVTGASAKILWAGVAESSGEFGLWSPDATPGTGLPGVFGKDYAFIDESTVDIFVDEHKVNLFRVAFVLERMCPLETGLGATFDEEHFGHFKDAVDYITTTKGAYAILDPHNYMRYNNPSQQPMTGSVIGNTTDETAATTEQFAAFWGELAGRFADNERVMFGIMNEPHDMPTKLVFDNNQAAVDAIRAAGAKNLILVPGGQWSGGHSWTEDWGGDLAPNSEFMAKINDPENNFVLDVHEYLDEDYSGTHTECVNSFPDNLAKLTAWLKENSLKAMITEFGGSNTTACETQLSEALQYMEENEEYIGWTAWAAGPFWGPNSACCTDSRQLGSLEPGSKAADGSPGLYETLWLKVFQPLIPSTLQWEGPARVSGAAAEDA
ncbi:probable Endoglucanase 1 [Cephalotrichum gorgonifer]|uniref:cellulase n=1 Tax=Cephalotrichum gorgonifer TaxID=2041049 RepID=A0AAE8SS75_9PEZI|nr:probable Endoglucanase 1 [Cephalotrichum gorgonifer]